MQVHTRNTPAFGVARVVLAAGEVVQARGETMLASSFGVAETQPGRSGSRAGKGLPSVFSAPPEGGWIDFAPSVAGDVYPLELDGTTGWSVHLDAPLVRPASIRLDQGWPALQSLFGGDGGFLEHYSGAGPLVLASAGPVDAFMLEAGELVTVRPGYLLAFPDTVQVRLRAIDPAGPQSLRTGEGLALDFAGPGTVLVQSRARG